MRVWKFLMDVVGNTPKSSAIPNFAKSGKYLLKGIITQVGRKSNQKMKDTIWVL